MGVSGQKSPEKRPVLTKAHCHKSCYCGRCFTPYAPNLRTDTSHTTGTENQEEKKHQAYQGNKSQYPRNFHRVHMARFRTQSYLPPSPPPPNVNLVLFCFMCSAFDVCPKLLPNVRYGWCRISLNSMVPKPPKSTFPYPTVDPRRNFNPTTRQTDVLCTKSTTLNSIC